MIEYITLHIKHDGQLGIRESLEAVTARATLNNAIVTVRLEEKGFRFMYASPFLVSRAGQE